MENNFQCPTFITGLPLRVSPLYDFYYCYVYSFCIFYRPLLTIPRDLKYVLYDYYYCSVYSFCIFYRPLLTIPRGLNYVFFSVGYKFATSLGLAQTITLCEVGTTVWVDPKQSPTGIQL